MIATLRLVPDLTARRDRPACRCGATPTRLYIQGHLCANCAPGPPPESPPVTGPALRPTDRYAALDKVAIELAKQGRLQPRPAPLPACPERAGAVQCPQGLRVRTCGCCGRITARLDGDGVAWCGGVMPEPSSGGAA